MIEPSLNCNSSRCTSSFGFPIFLCIFEHSSHLPTYMASSNWQVLICCGCPPHNRHSLSSAPSDELMGNPESSFTPGSRVSWSWTDSGLASATMHCLDHDAYRNCSSLSLGMKITFSFPIPLFLYCDFSSILPFRATPLQHSLPLIQHPDSAFHR